MQLQDLERAVQELSTEELKRFAEWFDELRSTAWDQRIERDYKAGDLDALLRSADADFEAGRAEPL